MFRHDLLAGKRVLVTGGGTGLGLAMGRRFVELGAELAICGRREAVLRKAAEELQSIRSCSIAVEICDESAACVLSATVEWFVATRTRETTRE